MGDLWCAEAAAVVGKSSALLSAGNPMPWKHEAFEVLRPASTCEQLQIGQHREKTRMVYPYLYTWLPTTADLVANYIGVYSFASIWSLDTVSHSALVQMISAARIQR